MIPRFGATLALTAILLAAGCSRLPRAQRILLVTFDTTRADHLGCYGYTEGDTRHLDALAEEGVVFEQAFSAVPTTLPSHATIFTGLYPHDHGVRYNIFYRLSEQAKTLAESLQAAGFATAGFPASQVVAERFGLRQGFDTWVDPPIGDPDEDGPHPISAMRTAGEGVDLTRDWFREQQGNRAFAWLHFYDPHWPYTPPFPQASTFRDRPYDGEIAYADAQLGRLLDQLRQDPEWEQTLVIVAADHGEGLYEHGERYHATLLYETTQRVPLIVRAPGAAPGRVRAPVTLADLMPTVLDLAGLDPPGRMRGISLRPALQGKSLPDRDLYAEVLTGAINYGWAELFAVRYGDWKLIDSTDPELFNLADDPGELDNRAAFEPERVAELRNSLDLLSEPITDSGADAVVDMGADAAAISGLGYVAGSASTNRIENAPHPRAFVNIEVEILQAQGALARKRYGEVIQISEYVLSQDPTNIWALSALAQALLETGRGEESLVPSRRLVELNPDSQPAHVALAAALARLGRPAEARQSLSAAIARFPDSEQLAYLGIVAGFEIDEPVCDGEVPAAVDRFPESARIRLLDARCQARGGDVDAALEALRQAVDRGFRRFEVIESAPDFAGLVADERFGGLVESTREADSGAGGAPPG